jgi:hypothetical protein
MPKEEWGVKMPLIQLDKEREDQAKESRGQKEDL